MQRIRHLFLCSLTVFIFISCKKEKSFEVATAGSSGDTELGNWKFLWLQASTSSVVEVDDGVDVLKALTVSDYTTEQNGGAIKFDGTNMTATGLTYSINDIAKGYFYDNGVLYDSLELPMTATLPSTNATAGYKKIGTDSLYFASGSLMNPGTGGGTQTLPGGYKLKFMGDTMTMTLIFDQFKSETTAGLTTKTTNHAVSVTTLLRL